MSAKIKYGISETIGWRPSMEDAYEADIYENLCAACVYDGHLGAIAAQLAAQNLTALFLDFRQKDSRPDTEVLREAYLACDRLITDRGIFQSGTTAANLYIKGDCFLAANAGDSRVVIGTSEGARPLTVDHKPDLPEEKLRIESLNSRVISLDIPRVEGELAMSRALGDAYLKPAVSAEPRVTEGCLGNENDYAIVACDGVWDVLSGFEAVDIARSCEAPETAAEKIQQEALDRRSTDNITVIVLDLRPATKNLDRGKMSITGTLDKALE